MNHTVVTFDDSVKITAAGFIHLRVLCERLEYLYGVLTVTPIADRVVASQLAEFIQTESRSGHLGGFQQVRAVESFLKYLRAQFAHLKGAYPEFGAERTGAAFMLGQIESATAFFRNPTVNSDARNVLDE